MHVPTIYIFTQPGNDEGVAHRIKAFQDLGFAPLVDSVHGCDLNWFKRIKAPHRLYIFEDDTYIHPFTARDLHNETFVDVMIAFNEDEEVSCLEWAKINDWVMSNLDGRRGGTGLDKELLEILQVPFLGVAVEGDRKCTDILGEAFVKEEVRDCYGYSEYLVADKGVKVYEIIKPNVDLPYVTIVENYKESQDDLDMFSGFFAASSWGVAVSDIQFMAQLWKWKMMPGEFNCEEVVKARVDRVVKGGEPEPRVWRNTLQNVIEIVEGGTHRAVLGKKRRGDTFLETVKKNK